MSEDYTLDTLRTVRRNAGLVPAAQLAASLGWTEARLDRVAVKHHIDLRMLTEPVFDDARKPRHTDRRSRAPGDKKTESFGAYFRPADAAFLIAKAAERRVKTGRLLSQIIEGAIAREMVDEFASAATTYRPIQEPPETPDRETI